MVARRLASGGTWIDRRRPVAFTFDGAELVGFAGDTLASALLANGVTGGFRSPLEGRPRGVLSAGDEEPNAFVEVSSPWFETIVPATMVNLVDHLVATPRAGVGRLPGDEVAPRRATSRHRHVETLVIGAGASGRAAADEAAARGHRVLVVEQRHRLDEAVPDGVATLTSTTALGIYDDGAVVLYQRDGNLDRIWHVRARRVVLATGAHERPIAFAGNDLPGVMLAGAAHTYVERFGVLPGERVAVFSTNHAGHEAAEVLAAAGATIVAVVDPGEGGPATQRLRAAGFPIHAGSVVVATHADERGGVAGVTIAPADGGAGDGEAVRLEADLVAVSGGWNPTVQLGRAIGMGLAYDEAKACFVPDGSGPPWLQVVGAAAGEVPTSMALWSVEAGDDRRKYVELQRDQTVADVTGAVGRGFRSVEHVKRVTYIGTTIDQGRTSGVPTAEITNALLGWGPGAQGPTNARPPYVPVPFSALAGLDTGPVLMDPVRTTPMHASHVARGAVFEDVGQWKRPWFFPVGDEDRHATVNRECLAVRQAAGVLDASTLGKIEVVGPDAGTFLDRMYTNRMSNLAVGSIRYGLMLGLDAMVADDGVAMRLADDRYLVTTTTGGAALVLDRFEEWLQTEWPDLRVFCTSVTEQWAVVAVAGPRARDVLTAAGTDIDLQTFPFMTFRDGWVAGAPARVCRVSFTGELSYEVHVPAWYGAHVWAAVLEAGGPIGLTSYGTEAMHVLRAEKGFVIVGQDTDGTVTAEDLGMGWIVNDTKGDFIGKRSLTRDDTSRADRLQLVGLATDDPGLVLPEGTQVVEAGVPLEPPVPMLGHVTSSYASAALGRSVALALVRAGRARMRAQLAAVVRGQLVAVTVVDPVAYDPEGARRDG